MSIYRKLKSGKIKEYKTIGEKKEYYQNRINDVSLTKAQRKYAIKRLKELDELISKKKAVSKNFVSTDGLITGKKSRGGKLRYGVCTKVRNDGSVNFNPFMPVNEEEVEKGHQVKVEAQKCMDREHAVRVHAKTNVNIDEICEDKGFGNSKTRKLTEAEFRDLRKRSKGNKKKRS